MAAFDELAERGFTVLMDDFGSGYSSLNMLKDINVDVLKIDMRFLDRDDRRSKDIMESVIRMARWLDLPVIAEGVETREQVNFLLDVGCSYAQGYYYARPMEAAAFEALLTDGSKFSTSNALCRMRAVPSSISGICCMRTPSATACFPASSARWRCTRMPTAICA